MIEREDGLPHLVDCSKCTAKTFRPMPDTAERLCGDCWASDVVSDDEQTEEEE